MSPTVTLVNAGTVLTGDLDRPVADGADTVRCADGLITFVGPRSELPGSELADSELAGSELIVDVQGATIAPGLIDSHCHVVLGDYTPRQQAVGFLASYVHG